MAHPTTIVWNAATFTRSLHPTVTRGTGCALYASTQKSYWIVRAPDGSMVIERTLALARHFARQYPSVSPSTTKIGA